jgi:AcrR family transcriptional regulator
MVKSVKRGSGTMKGRILDSAMKVLSQKELHECLIDEIAKKAGIGKGTVYLYFKSKEDIYYSILFNLMGEMQLIIDGIVKSKASPEEMIISLTVKMSEFVKNHGHTFVIIKERAKVPHGKLQSKMHAVFDKMLASISVIINRGIEKKSFKKYPPMFVSSMFFSMILTVARYDLRNRPGASNITAELLSDIFMNGIKAN